MACSDLSLRRDSLSQVDRMEGRRTVPGFWFN
jgi:hypothetical protein